MPEINALTELTSVASGDLLPIFDVSATSPKAKRITRANLLSGVAFAGGNHNFGSSTIANLTIGSSLAFPASTITNVFRASAALSAFTIPATSTHTETIILSGALMTDYLIADHNGSASNGVIFDAWISGTDTVTVRYHNTTASPIGSFPRTVRVAAIRFS